jgi:uncharacterized membrane protein
METYLDENVVRLDGNDHVSVILALDEQRLDARVLLNDDLRLESHSRVSGRRRLERRMRLLTFTIPTGSDSASAFIASTLIIFPSTIISSLGSMRAYEVQTSIS